ncbi:hypothetical protein FQZ97_897830 [compost metagenome]
MVAKPITFQLRPFAPTLLMNGPVQRMLVLRMGAVTPCTVRSLASSMAWAGNADAKMASGLRLLIWMAMADMSVAREENSTVSSTSRPSCLASVAYKSALALLDASRTSAVITTFLTLGLAAKKAFTPSGMRVSSGGIKRMVHGLTVMPGLMAFTLTAGMLS